MVDLSKKTIRKLFEQQVRQMTIDVTDTFDLQFSDRWLQ